MSSPIFLPAIDDGARERALDPGQSFTVQAPAGSGKTELLIQRFLRLLATVKRPESIVAITFTRKAAGEMVERITGALRQAAEDAPITEPYRQLTRDLARAALQRDQELGWNLRDHPGRLRIQTIDSLYMSIVGEMPWLARLGGIPRIEEDATQWYEAAAQRSLLDETAAYADALTIVLRRLDNNTGQARRLIAEMLARRDQWLPLLRFASTEEERAELEDALARTVKSGLEKGDRLIPEGLREDWLASARFTRDIEVDNWPSCEPDQMDAWRGLIDAVLTQNGWRQRGGLTIRCGFPQGSNAQKDQRARLIASLQEEAGLLEALQKVRKLPQARFSDDQWGVLHALFQTLRLAVAQLKLSFREQGVIDFIELGTAARNALGAVDNPTELAFHLDSRIEHLLVDEFQDTSRTQFELLEQLTSEWQNGDGRTLFIVGDPLQSIYRFRQAEVGLFLNVRDSGIGNVEPEPLQLKLNRRSRPAIVRRVTELLKDRFPGDSDSEIGAIPFEESIAAREEEGGEVTFDGFLKGDDSREAASVIRRIEEARAHDPEGSIAILVQARTHLPAITEALRAAGVSFQAVEIEPLEGRTAVRDLLALTRALLNPLDRVAWLAILRAPWCGLALGDLEALVRDRSSVPIEECLAQLDGLSEDGRDRAARVRDVMREALAERARWPLRRWVEITWMRLGGPATLQGERNALDDASAYLDLLEREQSGADLRDFDRLQELAAKLYARPANSAEASVQIMTIHKAKGLEFDTVIIPGLGRQAKTDDDPLILSHEWRSGGGFECLLAPIDETGTEKSPLYRYLRNIEKQKSNLERTRQLYVAMTRAKNRLHLLGHVEVKTGAPRHGTMLDDLWPKLTAEEKASCLNAAPQNAAPMEPKRLHRLPLSWSWPDLPQPVTWEGSGALEEELHEPSFEWVGESLRHVGTVVHAFLQRMAEGKPAAPELPAIRKAVAHAGVVPREIDAAAKRVQNAIGGALRSSRCQWILAAHEEARSEYAVTGLAGGEMVRGLVDRTFVENGIRWIIDFKTSTHEGGNLPLFVDEQQRRYRDQMERYASILAPLGNPVRLGLYFPLLDEWREWEPGSL